MSKDYTTFIEKSKYAKWLPELVRREDWAETVQRYITFMIKATGYRPTDEVFWDDMRAGYNCSYVPVDSPRAFDETMYILMNGTGVGFSVERQFINQLPEIADDFYPTDSTIIVADSRTGWAKAFKELISLLYIGMVPQWDVSRLRPAGAKLKTFGGRSSGPQPLVDLFNFTVDLFKKAKGRRLNSLECHDLMCKIGEIVVVGGVRRSAMISLSNLTDHRMASAKTGYWWETGAHRALANNSVAFTEKPDMEAFIRDMWWPLIESKSGERGIFNRQGARKLIPERRDPDWEFGTNPCSEIILRPHQFCNLTEVVVRAEDTFEDLQRKVRLASILGTFQSTLTDFKYLRNVWKKNTEEERLLGVSLTGIMDNAAMAGSIDHCSGAAFKFKNDEEALLSEVLEELKQVAIDTNKEFADALGISHSAAITCVKPSGTVSQLVDSASGIHPRFAPYYIRTVRGDIKDPLTNFLIDQGVPVEPCAMQPGSTAVFSFPMKAPEGAVMTKDRTAIEQLELWKTYQLHWCEHKPSITVYVGEDEWLEVGAWVYKNFDLCSGVSFLPRSDHTYQQAPYQEITADEYSEAVAKMPGSIDWSKLSDYELEDSTTGSQELACTSAQGCEVVDVGGVR
jgi:ribonucleoside-diphosphate reductase alpha chain